MHPLPGRGDYCAAAGSLASVHRDAQGPLAGCCCSCNIGCPDHVRLVVHKNLFSMASCDPGGLRVNCILTAQFMSWHMKPTLGLVTPRSARTAWYTSSYEPPVRHIRYAIAMVVLRETPWLQCTSTRPTLCCCCDCCCCRNRCCGGCWSARGGTLPPLCCCCGCLLVAPVEVLPLRAASIKSNVSYNTQVMSSCGWSATADSRSKQHSAIILQTRSNVPGEMCNNDAEPQLKCRQTGHGGGRGGLPPLWALQQGEL